MWERSIPDTSAISGILKAKEYSKLARVRSGTIFTLHCFAMSDATGEAAGASRFTPQRRRNALAIIRLNLQRER